MAISATMTVVGLLFKLAWLFLNQPDERIKDILGPHGLGTSDPYYWPRDVALASIEQLVGDGSDGSLLEIAQRANAQGDRGKAMLCTRLAMQLAQSLEAQDLLRRLLRGE
jgi:hypothetical protein